MKSLHPVLRWITLMNVQLYIMKMKIEMLVTAGEVVYYISDPQPTMASALIRSHVMSSQARRFLFMNMFVHKNSNTIMKISLRDVLRLVIILIAIFVTCQLCHHCLRKNNISIYIDIFYTFLSCFV